MTRMPERQLQAARRRIRPRRPRTSLDGLSATGIASAVAGLQVLAILVATALAPPPTDETVAWAWLGELLALGSMALIVAAFANVTTPRRSFAASFGAGVTALVLTVGCPVTGHHELAGWWFGQLAIFTTATGVAGYAWWRARRSVSS